MSGEARGASTSSRWDGRAKGRGHARQERTEGVVPEPKGQAARGGTPGSAGKRLKLDGQAMPRPTPRCSEAGLGPRIWWD